MVNCSTTTINPSVARAEFGADAKMTFPDVVQGMADRSTKQCLVESLGNRECLVYREDAEKLLYKGADVEVLLQRLQASTDALDRIPPLVESKQWNAITGILTGPMGQLSSTLTLICGLASNTQVAKEKAQVVKQDLFAMGTSTANKQPDIILKYQQKGNQERVKGNVRHHGSSKGAQKQKEIADQHEHQKSIYQYWNRVCAM